MFVHSHTHTQIGKHNLDMYYNSNHNNDINFYPKCCISSELKVLYSSTIYKLHKMTRNSKIQASRNVSIISIKAPKHKYNSIHLKSNRITIIIIDNFCVHSAVLWHPCPPPQGPAPLFRSQFVGNCFPLNSIQMNTRQRLPFFLDQESC